MPGVVSHVETMVKFSLDQKGRSYRKPHFGFVLLSVAAIGLTIVPSWKDHNRWLRSEPLGLVPLSSQESDLQEYQEMRLALECTSSERFDCLNRLRKKLQESSTATREALPDNTMDADKKRDHEITSIDYAIHLAQKRVAQLPSIYPPQASYPDEIPMLTPMQSEEVKAKPEWSDVLFPDFNVAGLHKCGTSQLTHIISSHPQVRKFGKLHTELIFKDDFLFDTKADSDEEQLEFQQNLFKFHQNLYKEQRRLTRDKNTKNAPFTVASTLVVDDAVLRWRYLQPKKRPLFFILTRDPADWLWAAWNFWLDTELDSKPSQWPVRGWATPELQYRSPELFHELLLGADRVKSYSWFHRLRDAAVASPRRFIAEFGKEQIFFARNEDMLPVNVDRKGGLLDRLSSFTGLDREGFRASVAKQIHNCNDVKGNSNVCNQTSSSYSIAGGRSMLPESRRLAYLFFAAECKVWKEDFGIEYQECLSALPSSEAEKAFVQRN